MAKKKKNRRIQIIYDDANDRRQVALRTLVPSRSNPTHPARSLW